MNKIFVKTQNVRNFIGLIENLINKPKNIPKMGLVYGEPGLGKSQTALWLACKYDGIYLRASNLMTGRWLLEEIVKELDEIPRFLTSDNFNIVVKKLKENYQVITIDTAIEYFLENYVKNNCKYNSYRRYRGILKLHISPFFKNKNLNDITCDDIQKFYYFCKNRNLPPKVLKNTLTLLNQMIKYFQNLGIIDRTCNFQVRRLSDKTNFTVDRIIFEV